jgi:hypothetical protein
MRKLCKILLITAVLLSNTYVLTSQNDALKILPNGNVGIGTSTPSTTLDVKGTIQGKSLIISDTLTVKTVNFKEGIKTSTGMFTGNATINNAFIGDVGHGFDWAGFAHKEAVDTKSYGFLHHKDGIYSLVNIKSGDGYIGFRADNADKMVVRPSGNVGIGTINPTEKLQVAGTIKATTIKATTINATTITANTVNGEKPPMIINVGKRSITNKWQAENRDVKSLCGDADGCTMKIFFQVVSNRDEVRTISEQIYIEQPNRSTNKNPGLHGYTRQLGGGDKGFVLGTTARQDIIPHPWDWIYVRNYGSSNVGSLTPAYKGYNLQFMTRPGVIATVIIYDR